VEAKKPEPIKVVVIHGNQRREATFVPEEENNEKANRE
jgi:hypothetical protein